MQPTTEQLMIAKMIDGHADDPHQRRKIQQVMDVTGKPEDEVATALFDAGWDESRAVELLLEDGDHLSAWEETGKKKKGKKGASEAADKEDWDNEHEGFQDPRGDKSRSRGPPRMRGGRGGSNAKGHHSHAENGDRGHDRGHDREGGPPSRRGQGRGRGGGRGGGSSRTFASRGDDAPRGPRSEGGRPREQSSASNAGGFQGSIDTWNNPNENQNSTSDGGHARQGGSEQGQGRRGGGRSGRGGGQSGKDAFDNAGNWGDDFPNADEWDNEEYTGSLADTKVFTASGGQPQPGQKQRTPQPQVSFLIIYKNRPKMTKIDKPLNFGTTKVK